MRRTSIVPVLAAGALLAGCGGGGSSGLREGVYQFELSPQYLRQHGIPAEQATNESGVHRITLDRGSFIDRWQTPDGTAGFCIGVYSQGGNRVTVRWTGGCSGDWAMSYSIDGDRVTWSDFQPLDPNAGPEDKRVTEVFNSVPWTRIGGVPAQRGQ